MDSFLRPPSALQTAPGKTKCLRIHVPINTANPKSNVFSVPHLAKSQTRVNAPSSKIHDDPTPATHLGDVEMNEAMDMSEEGRADQQSNPDNGGGDGGVDKEYVADPPGKGHLRRRRLLPEDEYDMEDGFIDDSDVYGDDSGVQIIDEWRFGFFVWRGPIETFFDDISFADEFEPAKAPPTQKKKRAPAGNSSGINGKKRQLEKTSAPLSQALTASSSSSAVSASTLVMSSDAAVQPNVSSTAGITLTPIKSTSKAKVKSPQMSEGTVDVPAEQECLAPTTKSSDKSEKSCKKPTDRSNKDGKASSSKHRVSGVSESTGSKSDSNRKRKHSDIGMSAVTVPIEKKKRLSDTDRKSPNLSKESKTRPNEEASSSAFETTDSYKKKKKKHRDSSEYKKKDSSMILKRKEDKKDKKKLRDLSKKVAEKLKIFSEAAAKESFEERKTFPDALKPVLLELGVLAHRNNEFSENLFRHLKNSLPYNTFTIKRLLGRLILSDGVRRLRESLEKSYADFRGIVQTLCDQQGLEAIAGAQIAKAEICDSADTNVTPDRDRKKFKWSEELRLLLWNLLVQEWELEELFNTVKVIENDPDRGTEATVRKSAYSKLVALWPAGQMTTLEISQQYSAYKRRLASRLSANGMPDAPLPGYLENGSMLSSPSDRDIPKVIKLVREIFPDPKQEKRKEKEEKKREKEKEKAGTAFSDDKGPLPNGHRSTDEPAQPGVAALANAESASGLPPYVQSI
ncbi:hypothetical protein DFJ73DRAFT_811989 [Zopfochytrium polystomum]|nr:hypothetical protein DFJ73DRAFT_811989 [Zopfochytrium polystomum]